MNNSRIVVLAAAAGGTASSFSCKSAKSRPLSHPATSLPPRLSLKSQVRWCLTRPLGLTASPCCPTFVLFRASGVFACQYCEAFRATEIFSRLTLPMSTFHTACINSLPKSLLNTPKCRTPKGSVLSSNDSTAAAAASSVSMFALVAAPVLRSVHPVRAAHWIKERKQYEIETTTKHAKVLSLEWLLYSASTDQTLVKSFYFKCKLDSFTRDSTIAKNLTDEKIWFIAEFPILRTDRTFFDNRII